LFSIPLVPSKNSDRILPDKETNIIGKEKQMQEHKSKVSRRDFLAESSLVLGAVVLCGCSRGSMRQTEKGAETGNDYYVPRQKKILEDFDGLRKHTKPILASSYGAEFAGVIDTNARKEFESVIPQIPYVGGDENELTQEIIQSAMALALYRAMKNNGKTADEAGELLYQTVEAMVASYPKLLTRTVGFYQMSVFRRRKTRRAALESQKRIYPSNWVFNYVEGDGKDFDWGVDYTECGIVKFFHAQGAAELTPYMCLADFPMSEAFGMGLARTTTIAEGAEKCNFRFKRGRETQKGWPPSFLKSA
jgi:hypothetical protein